MDGKMALYHECCFPTKSWWKKLLSLVLGGQSPQLPPPGSASDKNSKLEDSDSK